MKIVIAATILALLATGFWLHQNYDNIVATACLGGSHEACAR